MGAAVTAYTKVRYGILHGNYVGGSRLTEAELARDLDISRTPVREALRRLHVEGFVTFERHRGAVVAVIGADEAEEIFELRAVLEPLGARHAAERASQARISELRNLAEEQLEITRRRAHDHLLRIAELNDTFHRLLQSAANSPRLEKALVGLIEAPVILRTFGHYTAAELVHSSHQHVELVQAIEARDPDLAGAIMRAHILAGRSTYLRGPIGAKRGVSRSNQLLYRGRDRFRKQKSQT